MPRIAICGGKGQGKDTLAGLIMELDPRHERHAFADPLKDQAALLMEYARQAFCIPYSERIDRAYTDNHRDQFGPFWQWYGTEFVRAAQDNYWVDRFMSDYGSLEHCLLTDMRFPNEFAAAQANGFLTVRVHGHDRRPAADMRDLSHASEQHYHGFEVDIEVPNFGTMRDLQGQAEILLAYIDQYRAGSVAAP